MYEHERKWVVKIKRKKSRRMLFYGARTRNMRLSGGAPVLGGASAISISTLEFPMFMVYAFPNGVDLHTIENEFAVLFNAPRLTLSVDSMALFGQLCMLSLCAVMREMGGDLWTCNNSILN